MTEGQHRRPSGVNRNRAVYLKRHRPRDMLLVVGAVLMHAREPTVVPVRLPLQSLLLMPQPLRQLLLRRWLSLLLFTNAFLFPKNPTKRLIAFRRRSMAFFPHMQLKFRTRELTTQLNTRMSIRRNSRGSSRNRARIRHTSTESVIVRKRSRRSGGGWRSKRVLLQLLLQPTEEALALILLPTLGGATAATSSGFLGVGRAAHLVNEGLAFLRCFACATARSAWSA